MPNLWDSAGWLSKQSNELEHDSVEPSCDEVEHQRFFGQSSGAQSLR